MAPLKEVLEECHHGIKLGPVRIAIKMKQWTYKSYGELDIKKILKKLSSVLDEESIYSLVFNKINLKPNFNVICNHNYSHHYFRLSYFGTVLKKVGKQVFLPFLRTPANGHIMLNAPVLVRSLKLSSIEPC